MRLASPRPIFVIYASVAVAVLFGFASLATGRREEMKTRARLPQSGWTLTPAGTLQKTGDMLLGSALSPDGKTLALVNAGYNEHHLYALDASTGEIKQTFPLENAWNGAAWSPDSGNLYVSGGTSPKIHVFQRNAQGTLTEANALTFPDLATEKELGKDKAKSQAYVAGLAIAPDGKTLYAANFATDTIYALSLPGGAVKATLKLGENAHPYCLRISPDGKTLYATLIALSAVASIDTERLTLNRSFVTDSHPNDIAFAPDGRMFVSCGNGNSVDVIEPKDGLIRERIKVTLTPDAPAGTTPEALAIAPDGKTMYVANSDNNCVAVVDISRPRESRIRGFIPSGWYPTAVAVSPNGKNLIVGTGKGMGTHANPTKSPNYRDPEAGFEYIAKHLHGIVQTLPVPDDTQLAAYTRQVMENTPYRDANLTRPTKAPRPGSNPVPSRVGDPSPIKHVLYIIRENRTYDQILGDLKGKDGKPRGNGDPNCCLFGEDITPNFHELARQYVTLDNTYCSGEVSGNGHPWSTSAYSTDIGERSWMLDYGGHGPWMLTDRDIYPPTGRIWDNAEHHGVSFASYYYTWTTDNTKRNMPVVWEEGFDKRRDTENADVFIAELRRHERDNDLPGFMIMSLREDHTFGTSPGNPTPRACIASNDYGLAKIVEAFSKSKYWKETAIFVIQDDAQDGPDHVDAHRTVAMVISPYTRTGKVVSTFYNTTSLLRTMELILGLPPMSQYDASATPMYDCFQQKPDLTPYTAIAPRVNINELNTRLAYGAAESEKIDFSGPDQMTGEQVAALNRILWVSMKGEKSVCPPPIHRLTAANQLNPENISASGSIGEDE